MEWPQKGQYPFLPHATVRRWWLSRRWLAWRCVGFWTGPRCVRLSAPAWTTSPERTPRTARLPRGQTCGSRTLPRTWWPDAEKGKEKKSKSAHAWTKQNQSRLRLLTLCSLAVDSARTSQEGPKTAPPGTTSLSACGRINPHRRGSSGSTGCSLPSGGPGGRRSGTRSCPLCLCRCPRTRSSRTHPRLKRQEVTKTRVGLLLSENQNNCRWRGHLTAAGLGGEVVLETLRTPALVHARRVDASGRFFTDAGV